MGLLVQIQTDALIVMKRVFGGDCIEAAIGACFRSLLLVKLVQETSK